MFTGDLIIFALGAGFGFFVAGFIAHRWPSVFAQIDTAGATAVNAGIAAVAPKPAANT